MEHAIFVVPDSFLHEEPAVTPPRSGIDRMKRADLIAELCREQMRTQSMVKRKDELKATLLQCNKLLTDTRRALQDQEREHQLTIFQNQELTRERDALAAERDALLQQLQQEMARSEALRQQVLEQDQSKDAIVESILQENAAQETHLRSAIGELADQRDLFHDKMHEVEEQLEKIHEENNCSVCLSPWEAEGAHRMVSLKCGHLFGDSCIRLHLSRVKECPFCKQQVRDRDIRYIFGCHVLRTPPSAQAAPMPRQVQAVPQVQAVNQAQAAPRVQAVNQAQAAPRVQAAPPVQAVNRAQAVPQVRAVNQAQAAPQAPPHPQAVHHNQRNIQNSRNGMARVL
nr:E3 ubiquitin-protein ligase RFWD3-like [Drosophila takahashii]